MEINTGSKPQLKKSLYAFKIEEDKLIFAFTKEENIVYHLRTELQKQLLILLDGAKSIKEIYNILKRKGVNCTITEVVEEIERLYNLYLLEFNMIYHENRYSRQEIFWSIHAKDGYEFSQKIEEKIKNTTVTLLGLGGFGSHIFYNLIYAGIGRIRSVDYDRVSKSNLNRQILYKEKDIGKLKTDAAMKNAMEINRDIEYEFVNKKIDSKDDISELISNSDIAILAADSPREKIFEWTNQAAYETKVPVLFSLGFSPKFIRIGPLFIPGKTICFNCSMPDFRQEYDTISKFINSRNKQGSIVPYLSVAAGMMVLELFKHVTGFQKCMLYNSRINFNVIDYRCYVENFSPKPHCNFCTHQGG